MKYFPYKETPQHETSDGGCKEGCTQLMDRGEIYIHEEHSSNLGRDNGNLVMSFNMVLLIHSRRILWLCLENVTAASL